MPPLLTDGLSLRRGAIRRFVVFIAALASLAGVLPSVAAADDPPRNLLSAMDPSFETGRGGWTASQTPERSKAWKTDGSYSLHEVAYSGNGNDMSVWSPLVPVSAGTVYTAKVWSSTTTSTPWRVRIEWYDSNGKLTPYSEGAPNSGTGGGYNYTTGTAPQGAEAAKIRVWAAGPASGASWDIYLDGAMLVAGSTPPATFYASRPANLLSPMDPGFEHGAAGWTGNAPLTHTSTVWVSSGAHAIQESATAMNDVSVYSPFVPVSAGTFYSARVRAHVAALSGGAWQVRIEWWNANGPISYTTGSPQDAASDLAVTTGKAPSGALAARLRVFASGPGTVTWNVFLDDVMLVEGGGPTYNWADRPANLLAAMDPSFEAGTEGWRASHDLTWPANAFGSDGQRAVHINGSNDTVSVYSPTVPVTAGKTYSGRIDALVGAGLMASGWKVRLEWWNTDGPMADSLSITGSAQSTGHETATVTGIAPPGAQAASLRVIAAGTGTFNADLDGAMIVEGGGVPSYYWADRPANLLAAMDPSFEAGTEGWRASHDLTWPANPFGSDGEHAVHINASNDTVSVYSPRVPVTAGKTYSGRIDGLVGAGLMASGWKVRLEWWNADGPMADNLSITGSARSTGHETATVSGIAPAGAQAAHLRVIAAGTGTFNADLDGAMIVEGGVPAYYWGDRPANLLSDYNPSFERTAPTWTFTNPYPDSQSWHGDGCWSAHTEVTLTNGEETAARSPLVPVTAGKTYSARIIANVDSETELGWRVSLEWYDDSGRIDEGGEDARGTLVAGSGIRTGVVTGTAPQDATRVRVRFTSGTERTSQLFRGNLDNMMLVEGGVPTSYYGPVDPYPISTCQGGDNRSVDTPEEISYVRSLLGPSGAANSEVWLGLSPADRGGIYPPGWDAVLTLGGADGVINSQDDVDAMRAVIGSGDVAYGDRVWWSIPESERAFVQASGFARDPLQACREAFSADQNSYRWFCLGVRPVDPSAPVATAAVKWPFNLSDDEVAFCLGHLPHVCGKFMVDANNATNASMNLFSDGVDVNKIHYDDTKGNAMLHSLWGALMLASFPSDPDLSWDFLVLHEQGWNDGPTNNLRRRQSRMDIINDHVGHKRAIEMRTAGTLTDEYACRSLYARVRDHAIYIAPPTDPRDEYEDRGLDDDYRIPVYTRTRTYGSNRVVEAQTNLPCLSIFD